MLMDVKLRRSRRGTVVVHRVAPADEEEQQAYRSANPPVVPWSFGVVKNDIEQSCASNRLLLKDSAPFTLIEGRNFAMGQLWAHILPVTFLVASSQGLGRVSL